VFSYPALGEPVDDILAEIPSMSDDGRLMILRDRTLLVLIALGPGSPLVYRTGAVSAVLIQWRANQPAPARPG
jgi:hypothetical protein